MIDGMLEGLVLAFSWPAPLYLCIGILIGIWVGAVPGLGGAVGLALMLPFTFSMDTVPAFALLLGMYAVTSTSDSISAIMFGIPGTVASQATILDGYPLAKKGQAARAFGAAYTVSAFGGVVGALLLAISLPVILPFINAFGVPEFFMLSVLGLTMVGVLSGRSLLKGITVACFGLLLTTVGYADSTGVPRFHFGIDYLLDGLPMIPIVLGLFGIPELMELAVKGTSISRVAPQEAGSGLIDGIKDVLRYRWLTIRSALIGTYVGMLPGLGAAIVDWIAYGHAVQSARDKSQFGNGDIRGVIAPETANNAHKAGALIPTVAFGIPGSIGTAILLGALVIKGLRPGPDMLTFDLPLTFSMVWEIAIANVVAAGLLLFFARHIHKLAFLPGHLVVPGVMTVLLMGTWIATNSIGDWWVALAMGTIGYLMKQGGWPRPPLILALVLGGLMENNYQLSTQIYGEFAWFYTRPVVVIIEILIGVTVALAFWGVIKPKPKEDAAESGEGAAVNPLVSLPITFLIVMCFVGAYWLTLQFRQPATGQFPHAVLVVGLPLVLLILVNDTRAALAAVGASGGLGAACSLAVRKAELPASAVFIGYLLAMFGLTYLVGQVVALPLFVLAYLMTWGGYRWPLSVAYAAAAGLVVWAFYGQLMGLLMYDSLLFG